MFVSSAVSQIMTISTDMIFAFWIMDCTMLWHTFEKFGVTGFAHLPSAVCAINCAISGLVEYYIQITKP